MTDLSPAATVRSRTAGLAERTRSWRRRMALALSPELERELKRSRRRPARKRAKASTAVSPPSAALVTPGPEAPLSFPAPVMGRHAFLRELHERLRPRNYLEIGVNLGRSLGAASCPSVGVDPGYRITADITCPVRLYRTTSDDYFESNDPRDVFGGQPVDLAFIDGMHLSEFVYRDFVNVERVCGPASVVVLDDMLPRDVDEAARDRHSGAWAGDVYKVAEILRRRRPDLVLVELNTEPTGTVLVLGLDPESDGLAAAYDSELDYLLAPDPQQVPSQVLNRGRAIDPAQALASSIWSELAELRDQEVGPDRVATIVRESALLTARPVAPVAASD